VESEVPRVGKRVFVGGDDFDEIQRGVFGFKVRRVEACRGTEPGSCQSSGDRSPPTPLRVSSSRYLHGLLHRLRR
jgi:hypothetical protein